MKNEIIKIWLKHKTCINKNKDTIKFCVEILTIVIMVVAIVTQILTSNSDRKTLIELESFKLIDQRFDFLEKEKDVIDIRSKVLRCEKGSIGAVLGSNSFLRYINILDRMAFYGNRSGLDKKDQEYYLLFDISKIEDCTEVREALKNMRVNDKSLYKDLFNLFRKKQ